MAMHGATTAEVSSACGPDDSNHAKALRVLQSLDGEPIEIVRTITPSALRRDESSERAQAWLVQELIPFVTKRKLAAFAGASVSDGHTRRCSRAFLEAARAAGLGLRIRASAQSPAEAVRCAIELGAATVELQGAAGADVLHALSSSSTIATLAPGAAFHAGASELPPARDLIDSGAAVALATAFDSASAPSCSMAMALSLACSLLRMTPEEAIAAATLNAACSLGCGARTGSLEAGKQADFIVASVHDYRELPYYFGVQTIARVFRRGVEIIPGGIRPLAAGAC
jgi:imidazolonepropionase